MRLLKQITPFLITLFMCAIVGVAVGISFEINTLPLIGGLALLSIATMLFTPKMSKDNAYTALTVCSQISASINVDCAYPVVAGVKDRLIIMNYSDLLSYSVAANPLNITALVLASGQVAYEYMGQYSSNEGKSNVVKKTYARMHAHQVDFLIFNIDLATKQQLTSLVGGKFVVILENNQKGDTGKSAFEVYGIDAGLELDILERNTNDDTTQGAFKISLKTAEKNSEPYMVRTLWDTSYSATLAIVEALL